MSPDLEQILLEATKNAGKFLRYNAYSSVDIEWKKKDDPVTRLDKEAERIVKQTVLRYMPANFVCEESGREDNHAKYTWIIDPLDGTKSFLREEFESATSVAVEEDGKLVGGCIYDFMRDIIYWSCGFDFLKTAYKNKGREMFGRLPSLGKRRISLDGDGLKNIFLPEGSGIRTFQKNGSIALGMAQLARGAYDGMVTYTKGKGHVWDVAAGYHLLRLNDFYIADIDMNPFDYKRPDNGIVALSPDIVNKVLPILKEVLHIKDT